MRKLLIFPYNGNGREAVDCAQDQYEIIGFIDDTEAKQGQQPGGIEIFSREILHKYKDVSVLAVPGSPASYLQRKMIIEGLHVPAQRFATVIHPQATVSVSAHVGYNVLIMAGVVITRKKCIGVCFGNFDIPLPLDAELILRILV